MVLIFKDMARLNVVLNPFKRLYLEKAHFCSLQFVHVVGGTLLQLLSFLYRLTIFGQELKRFLHFCNHGYIASEEVFLFVTSLCTALKKCCCHFILYFAIVGVK